MKAVDLQPIPHQELEITFVDDAQIAQIHGEYMDDPTPTDVITFPLGEEYAQLIISVDTCKRQALEFGNTFDKELILYMVHGILHLAGYDDRTKKQITQMRKMESELLVKLGLA